MFRIVRSIRYVSDSDEILTSCMCVDGKANHINQNKVNKQTIAITGTTAKKCIAFGLSFSSSAAFGNEARFFCPELIYSRLF